MRYGRGEVRAAYHEAGYALIAMRSIHLSSIGIERESKRGGQVFREKKGWLQPVRGSKVSLEDNVLIELAGPMAETMCPFRAGRDYYTAFMADMHTVEAALKEILTDSECGEYLNECRHKVEQMLKHHWPEVKALAKSLLKHKRLTGRQAERIAGEVWEKERGNHPATRYGRKKGKSISKKPLLHGKPEILTPNEIAELLRVSRGTINHLVSTEGIPFVRIGKRAVRFKHEAVMQWFREQNTKRKGR